MALNEAKESAGTGKDAKSNRPEREEESNGKDKLTECARTLLGDKSNWASARKISEQKTSDQKDGNAKPNSRTENQSFPSLEIEGLGSFQSPAAEVLACVRVFPELDQYEPQTIDPDWQGDGQNPTDEQSQSAHDLFKDKLGGVMDADTIGAIQRNEISRDYDTQDSVEDTIYSLWPFGYPDSVKQRLSIGPAQMQLKQIEELKEKYPEELKDVDPQSPGGAQKLIAAYCAREKERFDNCAYAPGSSDRPRDHESEASQKRFEALQERWNQARHAGNNEEMRKILVESYNSGLGQKQVEHVDSERKQQVA